MQTVTIMSKRAANQLKETLLNNKLFQQLIDFVATSGKKLGRKAAYQSASR